jgi:hypothetical protein
MNRLVVEIGMKLDRNLVYYHELLTKLGAKLAFSCITHDYYYSKKHMEGLTEHEMKKACIRLRDCQGLNRSLNSKRDLLKKEKELLEQGYKKVFDTVKVDFQYSHDDLPNGIELQDIKDVGLLVYYNNRNYYELPLDQQREMLIKDLNKFGFNFKLTDLGVDKLRTLYYNKEMYSKNQNE